MVGLGLSSPESEHFLWMGRDCSTPANRIGYLYCLLQLTTMKNHRVIAIVWGLIYFVGMYFLVVEVGSWWSNALGLLLAAMFLKSVQLAWLGLPPSHAKWAAKAKARSTTHCTQCGEPLSMIGTMHCQVLSGIELRDQFVATHGVLCSQHAALLAERLAQERGFTECEVQEALEIASHEMMEMQGEYARRTLQ